MQRLEESLSPLDATFLELEQADEGALMHIGAGLVFDSPPATGAAPSQEQIIQLIERRLDLIPSFAYSLSEQRVHGLRRPVWRSDPHFDVRDHVRHATLPAPGGEAELHDWLGDFWSHRLDRRRPLWEMTLVDGLADGGWMLATKTHHAMVDGVGSMDIGHVLLDAEPDPAPRPVPSGERPLPDRPAGGPHLPGWLAPAVSAARAAADTALHPRRLAAVGQSALAMGEVFWADEVRSARHSTLNVPIGSTREFVGVPLELAGVKRIKQGLGGTVNDVVLAISTGGLRRLLEHRGEDLEHPLRAMVPVNLRGDDHTAGVGNQVSSLFVDLPVAAPDPRSRYERVRAAAGALKSGSAARGTSAIIFIAGLVPPVLHESVAQMLYASRLFNITITNVPGPQFPLYALGSRLRRILPLVPLAADHALGMAIVSYDGELVFGVNADRGTMPDLAVFEQGLRDEYEQLLALAAS